MREERAMNIAGLAEVLVSGIASGAVYAILALGLSLVYGISRIFNFAYGSFFTWGAYLAWVLLVGYFSFGYPIVFIIVCPLMFLFGLLVDRGIIRPLRQRASWQVTAWMATLGLALFLDNTALVAFGPHIKSLPALFEGTINLGGSIISRHDVAMLLIAISIVIILELFLEKTRMGMAMRAVAQDMVGAQMMGIPVNKVFCYIFAISTVMAGIAGVILASKYFITPQGGWEVFIKAFVIIAFGGLGSIKGTLYAAFILGIVEALVAWQFGFMWIMVLWFAILLGVLIIRPRGLFGTTE